MTSPLVSICCLAYNHAPFIRQCLDGFMMQETDFDIEVLVHDDASTDGTADIIREYELRYPGIIKPIYQSENQYSKGVKVSIIYNFSRAKGQYIAMCEGDDYWIDPHKLQKQVDFLEANPEYSLSCHRYRTYIEKTQEWAPDTKARLFSEDLEGITFDWEYYFNTGRLMYILTAVCRKNAFEPADLIRYKYGLDIPFFYHILKSGKGYAHNFTAAVYRVHTGGVWSGKNYEDQVSATYEVHKDLYKYNKDDTILRKIVERKFERYRQVVIRPILSENKITKDNIARLISCTFDELRFFGLKYIGQRIKRLLKSP